MAILTSPTGLANELAFNFTTIFDGLTIGYLRFTYIGFYGELSSHPIYQNIQM